MRERDRYLMDFTYMFLCRADILSRLYLFFYCFILSVAYLSYQRTFDF